MSRPYVITIIPAHNEAKSIAATLHSVRGQVDKIVVACDNCSDDTFQVAQQNGADQVFNTVDNNARKAGALNQALERYVDWRIPNLYIMIMDADTQIVPTWMEKAKSLINLYSSDNSRYSRGRKYDAVGSVFYSDRKKHPTMLEMCQHNEWVRYANKIRRDRRVFVLTGTCSLISGQKLWSVYLKYNRFYDEHSITEDFAMTVDLKSVGARMISPMSCRCTTRTMRHYRDLVRQRRRWYLGALELILHRRTNRVLWPYVWQQVMLLISVFAFFLFLVTSLLIYITGDIDITLFWTVTFLIFDTERVLSIWQEPLEDRLFAASMIPELIYSLVLQWAYILAWISLLFHRDPYWNHYSKRRKP